MALGLGKPSRIVIRRGSCKPNHIGPRRGCFGYVVAEPIECISEVPEVLHALVDFDLLPTDPGLALGGGDLNIANTAAYRLRTAGVLKPLSIISVACEGSHDLQVVRILSRLDKMDGVAVRRLGRQKSDLPNRSSAPQIVLNPLSRARTSVPCRRGLSVCGVARVRAGVGFRSRNGNGLKLERAGLRLTSEAKRDKDERTCDPTEGVSHGFSFASVGWRVAGPRKKTLGLTMRMAGRPPLRRAAFPGSSRDSLSLEH